jgi:hypothetical protein
LLFLGARKISPENKSMALISGSLKGLPISRGSAPDKRRVAKSVRMIPPQKAKINFQTEQRC